VEAPPDWSGGAFSLRGVAWGVAAGSGGAWRRPGVAWGVAAAGSGGEWRGEWRRPGVAAAGSGGGREWRGVAAAGSGVGRGGGREWRGAWRRPGVAWGVAAAGSGVAWRRPGVAAAVRLFGPGCPLCPDLHTGRAYACRMGLRCPAGGHIRRGRELDCCRAPKLPRIEDNLARTGRRKLGVTGSWAEMYLESGGTDVDTACLRAGASHMPNPWARGLRSGAVGRRGS
jgi:hypothetical protein